MQAQLALHVPLHALAGLSSCEWSPLECKKGLGSSRGSAGAGAVTLA